MNYLGKFLLSTAEVCEPLSKLTSSKCKRPWNNTYQNLHDRAKNITQKNATMAFYNKKGTVNLGTSTSGIGVGASFLQVRDGIWFPRNEAPDSAVLQPIVFTRKSLTNTETCFSNTEREVLGILHNLEKFHDNAFTVRSV